LNQLIEIIFREEPDFGLFHRYYRCRGCFPIEQCQFSEMITPFMDGKDAFFSFVVELDNPNLSGNYDVHILGGILFEKNNLAPGKMFPDHKSLSSFGFIVSETGKKRNSFY